MYAPWIVRRVDQSVIFYSKLVRKHKFPLNEQGLPSFT